MQIFRYEKRDGNQGKAWVTVPFADRVIFGITCYESGTAAGSSGESVDIPAYSGMANQKMGLLEKYVAANQ